MAHVHPCPVCYEHVPCELPEQKLDGAPDLDGQPIVIVDGCTIEPDLQLDDGTPSGSYVVCAACRTARDERALRRDATGKIRPCHGCGERVDGAFLCPDCRAEADAAGEGERFRALLEARHARVHPMPTLQSCCEAVLLFHRGGPWTAEDGDRWRKLTGGTDASTKGLCDAIRVALGRE